MVKSVGRSIGVGIGVGVIALVGVGVIALVGVGVMALVGVGVGAFVGVGVLVGTGVLVGVGVKKNGGDILILTRISEGNPVEACAVDMTVLAEAWRNVENTKIIAMERLTNSGRMNFIEFWLTIPEPDGFVNPQLFFEDEYSLKLASETGLTKEMKLAYNTSVFLIYEKYLCGTFFVCWELFNNQVEHLLLKR